MKFIFKLIIMGLFSCFIFSGVNAKTLSIDEFKDNYMRSNYVKSLIDSGIDINVSINKDRELFIINHDGKDYTLEYDDEYISYKVIVDENDFNIANYLNSFMDTDKLFVEVLGTTLYNTEYADYTIDSKDRIKVNNDNVITVDTIKDGGYTYLKGFKISLDSVKVGNVMKQYGKYGLKIDNKLLANIKIEGVSDNQVTIYPKVDDKDKRRCIIYRSKTKDGIYEKISKTEPVCDGSSGIADMNLDEGSNYYYKVRVVNSSLISEPIMITTNKNNDNNSGVLEENSDSYNSLDLIINYAILIGIVIIVGVIGFVFIKIKSKINNVV